MTDHATGDAPTPAPPGSGDPEGTYDNPAPGFVRFSIEAWPHEPGLNGEEYVSGNMRAEEAASWLREIADRCEKYWNAESVERRHDPANVDPEKQRRDEEAKRRAYEATRPRPTRNPLVGLWQKRNSSSGHFTAIKKSGDVFKGVRREN
jgi:hypothetical protein